MVVSHASAASLHGFGTFVPTPPNFTTMRRRFDPRDESVRLYSAKLLPDEWHWMVLSDGVALPVTTPARTVVDLASAGEEREHVLDALAEGRDSGLIDDDDLAAAIERRRRRRGRGSVAWLSKAISRG